MLCDGYTAGSQASIIAQPNPARPHPNITTLTFVVSRNPLTTGGRATPIMTSPGVDRTQEWDRHQAEIWRLYLAENRPLKAVMEEMKQRHAFSPKKEEWTDKLKEWGCYKNLPKNAWRYVGHQTRKRRRSDGGGETCVVLSGVRLSHGQVQKGVRNHCPGPTLKLARHRSPSPHLPLGLPLQIYTPPATDGAEWPASLPWLQFHNSTFQTILPLIERHAIEFPLLTALLSRGSGQLVRHRQAGQIHKHLSLFMPETAADQHIMRAESVCHQGSRWANLAWLEMAFFFSSNNIHFPLSRASSDGRDDDAVLKASDKMLLELFRLLEISGAASQMLASVQAPTAQSLLDRLFASAVRAGSIETLGKLIAMDPQSAKPRLQAPIRDFTVHGDEMVAPVNFALRAGDFAMVDFLLEHGATLAGTAAGWTSSLRCLLGGRLAVAGGKDGDGVSRLTSIIQKIFQSRWDALSETELLRYLDRMRWAGHKKGGWANAPDMMLDHLEKMEEQSTSAAAGGLKNPLHVLIHAICYGHSSLIAKLVPRVPDLDAVWEGFGEYLLVNPMTEAAWAGDLDTCSLLLRHGASVDPTLIPTRHSSALQIAAHKGNIPMAKLLLDQGANIDYSFHSVALHSESTPLGAAIAAGQRDMVQLLLHRGADPAPCDLVSLAALTPQLSGLEGMMQQTASSKGQAFMGAALLLAARRGLVEVAELLVQSGASWTYENDAKETPLALSLALGHMSLVKHISKVGWLLYDAAALLAATAMATVHTGISPSLFDAALRARGTGQHQYYHHDHHDDSWVRFLEGLALATAVCLGNEDRVHQLLNCHIQPVKTIPLDARGRWMTRFYFSDDSADVSGIGPGCRLDHHLVLRDATLLGTACFAGQPHIVRLLLDRGYRPTAMDLAIAAQKSDWDTVQRLLTLLPHHHHTILASLILRNRTNQANSLLDRDPTAVNTPSTTIPAAPRRNITPLEAAITTDNITLVNRLLALGAETDPAICLAPRFGVSSTPLTLAVSTGNIATTRLLIEHGAECFPSGPPSALEEAAEHGRIDVLRYLLTIESVRDGMAGAHRERYLRAVRLAESGGHRSAARLLRDLDAREWSDEDDAAFARMRVDDDWEFGDDEDGGDGGEVDCGRLEDGKQEEGLGELEFIDSLLDLDGLAETWGVDFDGIDARLDLFRNEGE
ncbi:ankyrin repeat-containing domain protein [Podospora aff. communis PSN243]|uniref:Ankyrin repeat-containing domain protein n=1 Tax=Podospora aff. communis PSN243 TaxID=3040156 RepID=A0AAV9H3M0_9PEZI|nr:ankyrin repeat-containing domain protein [Podospora aff. communis PSN243]